MYNVQLNMYKCECKHKIHSEMKNAISDGGSTGMLRNSHTQHSDGSNVATCGINTLNRTDLHKTNKVRRSFEAERSNTRSHSETASGRGTELSFHWQRSNDCEKSEVKTIKSLKKKERPDRRKHGH